MPEKITQKGAEAIIILNGKNIVKRRVQKSYRLPLLDEKLRSHRTRAEAKLLEKASKVIPTPKIINVDKNKQEIEMPFIDGKKLSEHLDKFPFDKQKSFCFLIGQNIAKLHDADIIHGDLTTSNMILVGKEVYFIDFGLGFISQKIEDKAVDIHLLKQALEAKHFTHWQVLFSEVLKGYSASKESKKVLEHLKKVEARGRYKEMY